MKVEISLSSVFWALIFSFGYNLAAFRVTSAVSIKLSGFFFSFRDKALIRLNILSLLLRLKHETKRLKKIKHMPLFFG